MILAHRNKRAGKPAHVAGGHDAALLHLVVQEGKRGRGSRRAGLLKADFLEDVRDGIADCRCWREGQVDYPERHSEPLRGFLGDELAYAGYLEGGLLYRFAKSLEIGAATAVAQNCMDDARAGNTDIDDGIGLADAEEGTGHERIVVRGVAEHDKLSASDRTLVLRAPSRFLDDFAHETDGIHVDSGPCRADVHAGAEPLRYGHRLRYRPYEHLVGGDHRLRDYRRISADEIDAEPFRGPVEGFRDSHVVGRLFAASRTDKRDGGDGYALVDYGDSDFGADCIAGLDEVFRKTDQLLFDPHARFGDGRGRAVEQVHAHCDGADVEVFLEHHLVRLDHFIEVDHRAAPSDAVHLLEYLGLLAADALAYGRSDLLEVGLERVELLRALRAVDNHHHVEIAAQDSLGDIEYVRIRLREVCAKLGEDADAILANDRNYHFLHIGG